MGNQVCAGKVKAKKKDDFSPELNTQSKQNTVAPDTYNSIGETRPEINVSPENYLKVKKNRESGLLEDSKHEESKHGEEEERKMQFNGFESYTMKDSYKNLQDLDSMIFSGKAQNVATHGHKAHEAKVTQFVIEKIKQKTPFTDMEFPPSRDSLYNGRQDDIGTEDITFYESLQWRRLSEIYPQQVVTHKNRYRTAYLRMGRQSNHYFLASLDLLTYHDERIDKMMQTKCTNAAGIY